MSYINTANNAYPVSEQAIRAMYPNTSFAQPFTPPPEYAVVFPHPQPSYNPETEGVIEISPEQTTLGHWEQRWSVTSQPPAQIAAAQAAKEAARLKSIADKIDTLWRAADAYTSGFISGMAIGILTIGVLQQKPKALAVTAWSSAIWGEYYARKAAITGTSQLNLDFSSFGPIPYDVPALRAELRM